MDNYLKYLVCFILGWIISRMIGEGFSIGGQQLNAECEKYFKRNFSIESARKHGHSSSNKLVGYCKRDPVGGGAEINEKCNNNQKKSFCDKLNDETYQSDAISEYNKEQQIEITKDIKEIRQIFTEHHEWISKQSINVTNRDILKHILKTISKKEPKDKHIDYLTSKKGKEYWKKALKQFEKINFNIDNEKYIDFLSHPTDKKFSDTFNDKVDNKDNNGFTVGGNNCVDNLKKNCQGLIGTNCKECATHWEKGKADSECNPNDINTFCNRKLCKCENGTPVDNDECPIENKNICKKCNSSYEISIDPDPKHEEQILCQKYEQKHDKCKCPGGLPIKNSECPEKGHILCEKNGCNKGYDWKDYRCVERMSNGTKVGIIAGCVGLGLFVTACVIVTAPADIEAGLGAVMCGSITEQLGTIGAASLEEGVLYSGGTTLAGTALAPTTTAGIGTMIGALGIVGGVMALGPAAGYGAGKIGIYIYDSYGDMNHIGDAMPDLSKVKHLKDRDILLKTGVSATGSWTLSQKHAYTDSIEEQYLNKGKKIESYACIMGHTCLPQLKGDITQGGHFSTKELCREFCVKKKGGSDESINKVLAFRTNLPETTTDRTECNKVKTFLNRCDNDCLIEDANKKFNSSDCIKCKNKCANKAWMDKIPSHCKIDNILKTYLTDRDKKCSTSGRRGFDS